MTNESLVKKLLTEERGMSEEEYALLTEEVKEKTVKDTLSEILKSITDKIESLELTAISKSRGNVTRLSDFDAIQDSLNQLLELIDRTKTAINSDFKKYVHEIARSVMYLNQLTPYFKEAFRNKKNLLIMKYQTIVLSVISSISYVISVFIDYTDGISLKKNPRYEEIAPLTTLIKFNQEFDDGTIKKVFMDSSAIREYYSDNVVDDSVILEANDIISVVIDGLKNMYTALDSGGKFTGMIYKFAGVVMLVLSLREAIYTFFKMKTKVPEMFGSIRAFANAGSSERGVLSKLAGFARKIVPDAENASFMAKREIDSENKDIASLSRRKEEPVEFPKPEDLSDSGFNLNW